MWENQVDWILG